MIKKLIILILSAVIAAVCVMIFNTDHEKERASQKLSEQEKRLWNQTIRVYLQKDLQSGTDFYDAGHLLMVPLHYAYSSSDEKLMNEFEEHFRRFQSAAHEELDIRTESKRLSALQYYYLISQYIVLADKSGSDQEHIDDLANYLLDEMEKLWLETPAWQWGRTSFEGGMRQRVLWKLENKKTDREYYRAFVDEELFAFAIAADLSRHFDNNPVLKDILRINYRVFQQEGRFDRNGRWVFQPGIWSDHPDYLYAGYTKKTHINQIKPIEGIAADSSHFHRFPLWITNFIKAYPKGSEQRQLFLNIRQGLEKQFFDKVLVAPDRQRPYYKLNNFMDGRNGLYRWNYPTIRNNGYGPYELSGTFMMGWWTFLGSDRIKEVYSDVTKQFPLPREAVDLYTGPAATKASSSFAAAANSYDNGFKEILALLASKVR
ncbi:hypothetical protein [Pseudobacillus badius]|uniref:hypothetical protein n=1 Tax=Bacillus badius TaxID=1455 RepID=UPI0007B090DA|nr:hypothetical protein [Bacillus badius]KZO00027.1 hypothetical protein A4244_03750 [Bacillus badius]OCS86188.1 hypothetical protein A6M11_03745 [Bacillus badius]OVE52351.1 hypothetical protein B1A98_08140 [Bacillus badius]TDW04082.1 hypothetical protein B0G66_103381 [Bacillus badius]